MNLYIVRHAIAEKAGTHEDDSLRPLTEAGQKKFRKIAKGLKELEVQIDLILSSPYLRAAQTAEILRKTFDLPKDKLIQTEHLSPTGFADKLVEEIKSVHSGAENVAIVGHEPYLSGLASMLVAGDPEVSLNLKKGGVCCLSIDQLEYARCANLNWLLSPAQLVEIGD
ncbi:MAG: phosphohistidine phosphatase SixA [Chloroflexota bacterium]